MRTIKNYRVITQNVTSCSKSDALLSYKMVIISATLIDRSNADGGDSLYFRQFNYGGRDPDGVVSLLVTLER